MARLQNDIKEIGDYTYNGRHCLGEGAFGKVYEGKHKTKPEKVAVKKIDMALFQRDQYLQSALKKEIEILKKFNHENIVKFIDFIQNPKTCYLITELCLDGDLRDLLKVKRLTEKEVINILLQIVTGFRELNKYNIIHRDLKPANVLNNKGVVKIADFGFAKHVDNYNFQQLRSCVGSPIYMAPQILQRKNYTTKCDIWSLGVMYYEMLFNDFPWNGRDEGDLLKNIINKPLNFQKPNIQISSFSKEFLNSTLIIAEEDRISWEKLFELCDKIQPTQQIQKKIIFKNEDQAEVVQKLPAFLNQQQQNQMAPQQIAQQQQQENLITLEQVNKQLTMVNLIRQEIAYRFFVNAELFTKQSFCKQYFHKSLGFEEFCLLLSKNVLQLSKMMISNTDESLLKAEQLKPGVRAQVMQNFKREYDTHCQFFIDIQKFFEMFGIFQNLLEDDQFKSLYEKDLIDSQLEQLEQHLLKKASVLVKEALDQFYKKPDNSQNSLEFLNLCDSILNIFLIRKQFQRNDKIDFDCYLQENCDIKDSAKFKDSLYFKLSRVKQ